MPAVDDPFGIAASLPGQLADVKRQMKDLSVNNTQALTQALAAASASAASARAAATALQASVVTPVTAVATSAATSVPFNVTATMLEVTIRDGAGGAIVYSYSQSLDGVQVHPASTTNSWAVIMRLSCAPRNSAMLATSMPSIRPGRHWF